MLKFFAVLVTFPFFLFACQGQEPSPSHELPQTSGKVSIPAYGTLDEPFFLVKDLSLNIESEYFFDNVHRTLTVSVLDDTYYLIDGVKVLEKNGEYLPTDRVFFMIKDNRIYLPVSFLEEGLGVDVTNEDGQLVFDWLGPIARTGGPRTNFSEEEWDVEKMVDYLSFFESPLKHASVSQIANHLPGAKRAYRNGFHEGIDWYNYASGGNIDTNTPVYAMAEGIVVRADHDYVEYSSAKERERDLELAASHKETPAYIFDRLRGRQVWIQYPNGVMVRFAHLHDIPRDIKVGSKVSSQTVIGFVGNSGTSGAVNNDLSELHLHQDILIYGELFWEPLTQEEVRDVLKKIF